MITPLQLKKAFSIRESGMSWASIADTIDEVVDDLVIAVQNKTGRQIPRETWNLPAGQKSETLPATKAPGTRSQIEGFNVEFDAGPPPPVMGDGRLAKLSLALKPGAAVRGMIYKHMICVRKYIAKRGLGAEFRWVDREKELVDMYVLPEPSRRQKAMTDLQNARVKAGLHSNGRKGKGGKP